MPTVFCVATDLSGCINRLNQRLASGHTLAIWSFVSADDIFENRTHAGRKSRKVPGCRSPECQISVCGACGIACANPLWTKATRT